MEASESIFVVKNVKKGVFSQPDIPALGEVANFVTDYFLLRIKFLANDKREFTT